MSISSDYLHCRRCNTRVALMEDYIATIEQGGIFNRVFNVAVSDVVTNHQTLNENTIANAYCVQCEALIGGEFIAVLQPDMHIREGRYLMNLSTLSLRPNEDNADQGGDTIDLDEDAPHQDGDTTDQDGDADEKDLGTNGENVDQDGDTTEKNEDTSDQYGDTNEQNANQAEDGNEQVPKEQNVGANEQNVDQDGGSNEQNHDEDGGRTMKRRKK